MNVTGVTNTFALTLSDRTLAPAKVDSAPAASAAAIPASTLLASVDGNLTQQAAKVFSVLRAGTTYTSTPAYVLPANGVGLSRLFSTLQAIAVERVYPAPLFSFQA